MFKKILVANDGSEGAIRALEKGIELAQIFGAELWSLSVEGPLPAYAAIIGEVEEARIERENYFKAIEDEAERIAKEKGVELKTKVAYGHPADVIIRFAEERNFDLIILAHKGHTLADRFLLGSTSDKVADHSKSSVLIVK